VSSQSFKTPVLFIVFNRLSTTKRVFEVIKQRKPTRLYIAADGPRTSVPEDKLKCAEVRDFIDNSIDWECEVFRFYRDENVGVDYGISGAISWFFEHEEEGILLEDDCLPDPSFFTYCATLLEKYRYDERVFTISGNNFMFGKQVGNASYFFSRYAHIQGWATWRRAWNHYDVSMSNFSEFLQTGQLRNIFNDIFIEKLWKLKLTSVFNQANKAHVTYHFAWNYNMMCQNALCAVPNKNLISIIGFGPDATHSNDSKSKFSSQETYALTEILDPDFIIADVKADRFLFYSIFFPVLNPRAFIQRIISLIKSTLK